MWKVRKSLTDRVVDYLEAADHTEGAKNIEIRDLARILGVPVKAVLRVVKSHPRIRLYQEVWIDPEAERE